MFYKDHIYVEIPEKRGVVLYKTGLFRFLFPAHNIPDEIPPDVQSILSLAPDVYAALNHNQLPSGPIMWQDFDQNIPVTGPGQLVAVVKNLGSHGGFFVAESGTTRPEWTGDGLYFDGVDDVLQLVHPTMGTSGLTFATWADPGDEVGRAQRPVTDRGVNSPFFFRSDGRLSVVYGVTTSPPDPVITENNGQIRIVLRNEAVEAGFAERGVRVRWSGAVPTQESFGAGNFRAHTADGTNLGAIIEAGGAAAGIPRQHYTGLLRATAGWDRPLSNAELDELPITLGD